MQLADASLGRYMLMRLVLDMYTREDEVYSCPHELRSRHTDSERLKSDRWLQEIEIRDWKIYEPSWRYISLR